MKRLWIIFAMLFTLSCEDKKKPDINPPNISFISPTNGSNVEIGARNFEIKLNVYTNIDDNEGVLKAECFIDNISYGTKSGSPFNWEIDAYPIIRQGNHTIKIIAEDVNNNKSESSINFNLDVYHFVGIASWILTDNIADSYEWTFINSAEDGNNRFTYEVLNIPAFGYHTDDLVLYDGVYNLQIRDKNYGLAFNGKIDIAKSISMSFSISGNSYLLEVQN